MAAFELGSGAHFACRQLSSILAAVAGPPWLSVRQPLRLRRGALGCKFAGRSLRHTAFCTRSLPFIHIPDFAANLSNSLCCVAGSASAYFSSVFHARSCCAITLDLEYPGHSSSHLHRSRNAHFRLRAGATTA